MDWCSYFRLRDGVTLGKLDTLVSEEAKGYSRHHPAVNAAPAQNDLMSIVYHKIGHPDEPHYLAFASQLAGTTLGTGATGISHSVIALIDYNGHRYLLTFGSGHSIANRLPIERRFGKIVVSNGKVQDEVRSVTAKVHGSRSKTRIERRGKGGPTRELEVPRTAHMASGIAAKFMLGREHIASGDRAIRTVAAISKSELTSFLDQLESLWNGGVETDPVLSGYDRVVDVHDENVIDQLNALRRAAIVKNDSSQFSLCLEDDELWEATGFDYFARRTRIPIPVFDIPYVFGALHSAATNPPALDPLDLKYEAVIPGRRSSKTGFLADLLGFECSLPGHSEPYFFECGGWYQARAGWRVQVQQDVALLETQTATFLAGHGLPTHNVKETEDSYISRALGGTWPSVCHQFHLQFGPAQPYLEACDIMHDGKHLFFIKQGSGRDSCGDVVQQATDAANALVGDPAFLAWVNSQVAGNSWVLDMDQRKDLVFAVVLLVNGRTKPLTSLSIRAQDALSDHLREIEKLGFRAAAVLA